MELHVCHLMLNSPQLNRASTHHYYSVWKGLGIEIHVILPYLYSFPKEWMLMCAYGDAEQATRHSHAHIFSCDKPQRKIV